MLDLDSDDDLLPAFAREMPLAPKLPRSVWDRLFILYQEFEHLRYPGGETYARLDDAARTVADDFVEVRNPLERVARASMLVGFNANYQVRAERVVIPEDYRADDSTMRSRLSRQAPIRIGYLRAYL